MKREFGFLLVILIALVFFVDNSFGELAKYRVINLGTLDCYGRVWAINDAGQVAGGYYLGSSKNAVVWDPVDGKIDIGSLGGGGGRANHINNAGYAVGGSQTGTYIIGRSYTHAFLWDSVNGMVDLGSLFINDWSDSEAFGINNAGQVVGSSHDGSDWQAFLWDSTNGMVGLGSLGDNSRALGINNNSQVVGDYQLTTNYLLEHAFLWDSANGMVDIGTLGGEESTATAINDSGQVVGHSSVTALSPDHAFIWDNVNGMVDLGTFGGNNSNALAINDAGQVVGYADTNIPSENHAFVWDSTNGMIDLSELGLEDAGFSKTYATGINNSGQIVGYGSVGGETHAFIMTPVKTYYVDADAAGADDGSSWENAFTSLPYALDVALSGDEIRVAKGTYRPNDGVITTGDERELTFQLKSGVRVKGGYAGFGEPAPHARDIVRYRSILSGDLNGDDEPNFVNYDENSYTVVKGSGTDSTAVLDGFVITGGNNDLFLPTPPMGGGIINYEGSPAVLNCTFQDNKALSEGYGFGGGAYNYNSNAKFINCKFIGNHANDGGGVWNRSWQSDLAPSLINCTFYGNTATDGGAVYNWECDAIILNSILWNNEPNEISGYESVPAVTYCNVQGGWTGIGNIDADPCFADTGRDDFHLKSQGGRWYSWTGWEIDAVTSPCIDAGDPTSPIGLEPFANGGRINMGAYGGTKEASKSFFGTAPCETIVAGDINGDCKVNFLDFAIMADHWLWER